VAILTAMSSKKPRRSGNPANRASAAPGASGAAQPTGGFYAVSRRVLVRLTGLPPLVIPIAMMVLLLVGLLAPLPLAVPALLIVLLFIGWLAALSWPLLETRGRLMRGIMFGLVFGALVARLTGNL
jgi:hypothetical protein